MAWNIGIIHIYNITNTSTRFFPKQSIMDFHGLEIASKIKLVCNVSCSVGAVLRLLKDTAKIIIAPHHTCDYNQMLQRTNP